LWYLRHREAYLSDYFVRSGYHRPPRNRFTRAWRWYAGDVLAQSLRLVRANGRFVRSAAGVSRLRQLRQVLWLSVTVPAMPESYYRYEWYRPDNRARAAEYLHGHENSSVLYGALTGGADLERLAPLTDKVAFADHARAHGLAVVPTLAVVRHGEITRTVGEIPPADLFVKPLDGKRGKDAHRWVHQSGQDGFRRYGLPSVVPRAELLRVLAEESAGRSLLVQPCLVNHPDLADLALDAVVTCRVVTITDERGEPEPVIATFRMPAARDTTVDNMHRGGIAAPVEIGTGVLGPATGYATAGPATRHRRHPVTGAAIDGRPLPLWYEVLALVREAHRCLHPRVIVGWDVSVGPSGPVLLEGNERPGVGGLQRLHDLPLGSHRFGKLLAFHLDRRLSGTGREAG
jgi:hypothetical protein